MRIGFVGSQGTGKSTLIKALSKTELFSNYFTPTSPSRLLSTAYGMDISKADSDLQLGLVTLQYMNTFSFGDNVLLDRTIFDHYVYMMKLIQDKKSNIPKNVFELIIGHISVLASYLDAIVFLRPSFNIEEDGVRNTNTEHQLSIDMDISKALLQFNYPLKNILEIKGFSVEERVDKVTSFVLSLDTSLEGSIKSPLQ